MSFTSATAAINVCTLGNGYNLASGETGSLDMMGAIGSYVSAAAAGVPTARARIRGVFTEDFQTPAGWRSFLDHIPGWDVNILLGRGGAWWRRENFQALYVACWILHPVEKGSYMLKLETAAHYANVRGAYDRLLQSKELQSRISSHLSAKGASAHEGWNFLKGYHELLIQIEGEKGGTPYLFLKCEGHALDGAISTLKHGLSWAVKIATGAGQTASAELHNLAKDSSNVELRAAENFSKDFKTLQKQLGLSGKTVTVADVVDKLWVACGFKQGIPDTIRNDNHTLGRNMLGRTGYIAVFTKERDKLKKQKIDFSAKIADELTKLADRMVASAATHPQQHYHEVRVTAQELNQALAVFNGYTR